MSISEAIKLLPGNATVRVHLKVHGRTSLRFATLKVSKLAEKMECMPMQSALDAYAWANCRVLVVAS
jgi:hypothetical protein